MLDVFVACLAMILIALAVTLRNSMNRSLLGVAIVSIVTFSQTLSSFVNYWTSIEIFLAAVARARRFITETPAELSDGSAVIRIRWHRLESILDFDRVVVLDQGRVVECESPTVLLADEGSAFARLYRNGGW